MFNAKALLEDSSSLELIPVGMYIVDREGLVRGYNQKACDYWGQAPKLGDHDNLFCGAFKLYYPDGRELLRDESPMADAVEWGTVYKNAEVVILRPDQTRITVLVNINPLYDEKRNIIGAINAFQDITEIVAAREKIAAHQEELEKRDSFMSICSHELRTPLTVLQTQAQLALRKIEKNDHTVYEKEKTVGRLEKNILQYNRLSRLVDDMLDLHRIKSGNLSMNFQKMELGTLLKSIVANTVYGLDESSEKVQINAIGEIIAVVDRHRIEQVMVNLISNAIKYGEDGPIEVAVSTHENVAKIKIVDHGMGIAPQDQERIFERYKRVNSVGVIKGLGVGLFVTKEIVEAHYGKIYVESKLGKGSTFIVELPLNLEPTPEAEKEDMVALSITPTEFLKLAPETVGK
jgi:signal transduction histidine kinase